MGISVLNIVGIGGVLILDMLLKCPFMITEVGCYLFQNIFSVSSGLYVLNADTSRIALDFHDHVT